MDKQSEFLSFPSIYCGKTGIDNHLIIFRTTFPRVDDSFSLINYSSHCVYLSDISDDSER